MYASSTPVYMPYLHLAQYYKSALDILTAQSKGEGPVTGLGYDSGFDASTQGTIVWVFIGKIQMDLSYDPRQETPETYD